MVGFSFPIMAADNIADIVAKFGDFESIVVVGLLLVAVLFHHLNFCEPQNEELLIAVRFRNRLGVV
jgi:hypothetical protein